MSADVLRRAASLSGKYVPDAALAVARAYLGEVTA